MASSRPQQQQLPLGAVRTETGEVIVPASRRADGSVRKAIRIRQGYVPQDEVPKYKTVAQRRREQEAIQGGSSAASGSAPSQAPARQRQTRQQQQQRAYPIDADELSLESLLLESKAGAPSQRQQQQDTEQPPSLRTAEAEQVTARPRRGPQLATPATRSATQPRESADAHSGSSDSSRTALKQELSKLNKLLKEIAKLEERAQQPAAAAANEAPTLSLPQQRKVARKQELQRRRHAIITELDGAATSTAGNSIADRSSTETTTPKKKFVTIEL